MTKVQLKESLIHIAENITEETSLEDVFDELALLSDIEESEQQELHGETFTQEEVETMANNFMRTK